MKKHPFLSVDLESSVKLSSSEKNKMRKWLNYASEVVEDLVKNEKLMHPSWTKGGRQLRVSLLICGDSRIKKLNADYRDKNKVTDVLSFPSYESLRVKSEEGHFLLPDLFLGDLAICHPQTIRQAKRFSIRYMDEFIHLFFHGILHLIGYDHELSETEELKMQAWEEKALKKFSTLKNKK